MLLSRKGYAMEKPYLVLGLDIGIASCGWALLDLANCKIVDMGVHLWTPPHKKMENGALKSLAKIRREKRSIRRNVKRNSDRAKAVIAVLTDFGIVPEGVDKTWFQTVKGDPQPLESRAKALDELIDDRHFAQALYNISLRRGYIPHGESAEGADDDGKKVLFALSDNEKAMAEKGYRTIGEMFFKVGQAKNAPNGLSRNHGGEYSRCVRMSQLVDEANAIIEAQRRFGNDKATTEFQEDFIKQMTWEKDALDNDERVFKSVAKCVYFSKESAAAKACLSYELCCAFERVNHVRVVDAKGGEKPLPPDVKRWCMEALFRVPETAGGSLPKLTYRKIADKLDLSAVFSFKGVQPGKEKTEEVYSPKVWRLECKHLSPALLKRMLTDIELADEIGRELAYSSREDVLEARLGELDLSNPEIEELCKLPYSSKAFSGYGTRSAKALRMLVDAFEAYDVVNSLSDAEIACGLDKSRKGEYPKGNYLPVYQGYDPLNKNPVVLRVMARVRKLVNAVIREYGMPNEIHIELAGNLKHSTKEKKSIAKAQSEREEKNDNARRYIAQELGISESEVTGSQIRAKIMWDEQEGQDVYTKDKISLFRLLNDEKYCEVDHILPFSRTCDDGQLNKVLVLAKSNQEKGDRSPYEWLAPEGKWDEFEERVWGMRDKLPYKKVLKLLEKDLKGKENEFLKRNINDTRYATKKAKGYVEAYLDFPHVDGKSQHVVTPAGGATAILRRNWGFVAKDRDADDLHHAVDAAIVAACSQGIIQKVALAVSSKHFEKKEKYKAKLKNSEPWEGFADEVQAAAAKIIPTRFVDHGATGALFKETVYRCCEKDDESGKIKVQANVGNRKPQPQSNYVFRDDGSVVLPVGMLKVRLWWDGRKYLKEPIYLSDLTAIKSGTYVPRYCKKRIARVNWPEIPAEIMKDGQPIELFAGNAVFVGDELLRYKGMDISDGKLFFASPQDWKSKVVPQKNLGKAKDPSFLRLVDEDILGVCYKDGSEE